MRRWRLYPPTSLTAGLVVVLLLTPFAVVANEEVEGGWSPERSGDALTRVLELERALASATETRRAELLGEAARIPWPLASESVESALIEGRSALDPQSRRTWALDRALPMLQGELPASEEVLTEVLAELKQASLGADGDLPALQEARRMYAGGDVANAARRYSAVARGAGLWPDALRERAWALLLLGRPAEALGATVSLSAPYFALEEHTEGRLLRAMVFLERCRFEEARKEVASLADLALPVIDEETAMAVLTAGAPDDADLWRRALASPLVLRARQALELAGIAIAPGAATDGVGAVGPDGARNRTRQSELSQRRDALRSLAVRLVRDAAESEREALRELKERALRLRYETLREERALLESGLRPRKPRAPMPELLDDDEIAWRFDGTYWRDEIGAYRYAAGDACPGRDDR